MPFELRVCHPFNFPFLIDYDGSNINGGYGPLARDLVNDMERSTNVTFVIRSKNDGLGELVNSSTGDFDGCIGRIQRNESDFIPRLVDYPFPALRIVQGLLAGDAVTQFFSFYKPRTKEDIQSVEITTHFNSFNLDTWLLCLFTIALGYSGLAIRVRFIRIMQSLFYRKSGLIASPPTRTLKRSRHWLYEILVHMTARGCISSARDACKRIIFLSLSIFSLLVVFYFSVSIKTELVMVRPPITYRSYQDLLQHNVSIVFLRGMGLHWTFKSAAEGSIEKKLWDTSLARYSRYGVLIEVDRDDFKRQLPLILAGRLVGITDSVFSPILIKEMCSFMMNQPKISAIKSMVGSIELQAYSLFPLLSQDEHAYVSPKSWILNQHLNETLLRRIIKFLQESLERGMVAKMFRRINEIKISDSLLNAPPSNADIGLVHDCNNNVIYQPQIALPAVDVNHFSSFIRLILILLSGAGLVLVIEIILSRCLTRRPGRRRCHAHR